MQTHLDRHKSSEVPCSQAFNYKSDRERDMKMWIQKKFCNKWPGLKFARQPRKAMMLNKCQCTIAERREFRG